MFVFVKSLIVDDICLVGADRLEHLGQRDLAPVHDAGEHGTAADDDRRDVHPDRCHDHAGDNLVAIGDKHDAVQHMGGDHRLDAVGDELARRQRIVHAVVSHRDAVAHSDGRNEHGGAAREPDARLDGVRELVEVDVPGDDLAER